MSEYVLFSPLGLSDPTRGNYDGGFLHIMRHYRPQKAYLYMTKKISSFDLIDNRYEIMGNKLAEFLNFKCEIKKIRKEEVDNPQNFDYFFKPFEEIIKGIIKNNPGKKVILNVSSGTPAMKLACCMICAIAKSPLIPVQVTSFRGEEINTDKSVDEEYDIENEWANLIDNNLEFEPQNRCSVVSVTNLGAVFSREIILSLIQSYEYNAAIEVAKNIQFFIDPKIIKLLLAGKNRLVLNFSEAQKKASEAGFDLFPIKTEPAKRIFESILDLSIKIEKKELADFARAISPVISELFSECLSGKLDGKKRIENYCQYNKAKNIYTLQRRLLPSKIRAYYDAYFKEINQGSFKDSLLSASNILPMIIYTFGEDAEVTKLARDLRKFEAGVRNLAAHILIEVSDKLIKEKTGMNSKQVMIKVKQMYTLIYQKSFTNMQWDSYKILNKEIEKLLGL
jgi:CRISPR type III-A/MTUBE-associated protein Csm6